VRRGGAVPEKGLGLSWRVHKCLIFSMSVLGVLLMTWNLLEREDA